MTGRILVTGGFGYVGGRVAQALATRSDTRIVLGSRIEQGPPGWLPESSVVVTPWHDLEALRRACFGVTAIVHLAATNEIEAARDPVGALEATGVATVRLIEAAKAENVERFLYLSTAHVYGNPLTGRIDETVCPRPVHPYATSHRAAEDVVLAAHDAEVMVGVVLRLSNGFGAPAHPGVDRWTLLVNDLCRQAVTTGRLTLRSAGLQRRDFVTLSDVARAVAHLLRLPARELGNGIFNVGGAWAPTVLEMATLVGERCRVVLGFAPEIRRPKASREETTATLDYRIDRLLSTGFALAGNREEEIDATLRLCREAYCSVR